MMEWITWTNRDSGNPTTRAHFAEPLSPDRTFCGFRVGDLSVPALPTVPRCQKCTTALNEWINQRSHLLSKDGKTAYLIKL